MSCEKFEQLIALYVEGDASKQESREVEQHIGQCSYCREFIEELRESQQSLKLSTRSDFDNLDEALLRNLRQSVMAQISHKPIGFWQQFYTFFNWRFATAMAMVMILALAVTTMLYLRNMPSVNPSNQDLIGSSHHPLPKDSSASNHQRNEAEALVNKPNTSTPSVTPQRDEKLVRVNIKKDVTAKRQVVASKSREKFIAKPYNPNNSSAEFIPAVAVNHDTPTGTEEKLKIEIHTADPNVRIIWFTPRPSSSLSAS